MAEEVQRKTKTGDIVDEYKILPESITFERLLNTGNYENIRLGGQFKIPEGVNPEEALQQIADFVGKQVDLYLESKKRRGYAEGQLERLKEELTEFKKKLEERKDPDSRDHKRKMVRAQIVEVGRQLKEVIEIVRTLNYKRSSLHEIVGSLLQDNEFTLKELEIDEYQLPQPFLIKTVSSDQEQKDEEEEEDEDDYDYDDEE